MPFVRIKKRATSPAMTPQMKQAFELYVATLQDSAFGKAPDYLLNNPGALPWKYAEELFLDAWEEAARAEIEEAGKKAAGEIPAEALRFPTSKDDLRRVFTLDNPYTAPWIERRGADLVKEVTSQTKMAVRSLVSSGFAEHRTVQEMGRLIRGYKDASGVHHPGVIGLLERDVAAVDRYYSALLADGWTEEKALKAASRYSKNLLNRRGTNIARTETNFAQNHGTLASWQTVQDDGLLLDEARKRWIAAPSERTCPICVRLHNKMAPVNGSFEGGLDSPPAHPSCRCSMSLFTIVPGMSRKIPEPYTEQQIERFVEQGRKHRQKRAANRAKWLRSGAKSRFLDD